MSYWLVSYRYRPYILDPRGFHGYPPEDALEVIDKPPGDFLCKSLTRFRIASAREYDLNEPVRADRIECIYSAIEIDQEQYEFLKDNM